MLLQLLAQMSRGPQMGMQPQPQGFGFGQPPAPYQPPQIDTTPGMYNQVAHARAMQPGLPPLPGGDKNTPTPAPDLSQPPSATSQWASQGIFGAQPMANGQQAGLGQAGLASLLKLLGL